LLGGRLTAFRATLVTLHPHLVFALTGNWQIREFVVYSFRM